MRLSFRLLPTLLRRLQAFGAVSKFFGEADRLPGVVLDDEF